jgi:hypothetical protein
MTAIAIVVTPPIKTVVIRAEPNRADPNQQPTSIGAPSTGELNINGPVDSAHQRQGSVRISTG